MPKKPIKRMILEYLINTRTNLQEDFDRNLRFVQVRRSDEIDVLELLISLNRLQAFDDFMHDIVAILHMSEIAKKDG